MAIKPSEIQKRIEDEYSLELQKLEKFIDAELIKKYNGGNTVTIVLAQYGYTMLENKFFFEKLQLLYSEWKIIKNYKYDQKDGDWYELVFSAKDKTPLRIYDEYYKKKEFN